MECICEQEKANDSFPRPVGYLLRPYKVSSLICSYVFLSNFINIEYVIIMAFDTCQHLDSRREPIDSINDETSEGSAVEERRL